MPAISLGTGKLRLAQTAIEERDGLSGEFMLCGVSGQAVVVVHFDQLLRYSGLIERGGHFFCLREGHIGVARAVDEQERRGVLADAEGGRGVLPYFGVLLKGCAEQLGEKLIAVFVAVAIEAELSTAVRWQAGGYSIQVAATRPRALKYSRLPYQTKTRNWISDAHSLTTEQTTRRSRAIVLALQT